MDGQRLKKLREAADYTQETLADMLNVSTQQVHRWESGKNDPAGEMVAVMSKIFGVTTDYLLGLSPDPQGHITEDDLSPMERRLITAARNNQLVEALKALTSLTESSDEETVARR